MQASLRGPPTALVGGANDDVSWYSKGISDITRKVLFTDAWLLHSTGLLTIAEATPLLFISASSDPRLGSLFEYVVIPECERR